MKAHLIVILIFMFFCSGCNLFHRNNTTVPDFNTGEDVSNAQDIVSKSAQNIGNATKEIGEENQSIRKETDHTRRKVPLEAKKSIDPHLDSIEASSNTISERTQEINESVAELSGAKSLLNNAEQKIKTLENAVVKITEERDSALKSQKKAEEDAKSALHKGLRWIIFVCLGGAGVFAVLFVLHGSKFGLTGAAICAVVCAIAMFVEAYFIYVAIAGGILLLGLIGAFIYQVIIRNRALKETVETVEIVKDNLSNKDKEKLFGGEGETGVMNTIQSQSTMALVKREKGKINKLWSYAKRKANNA